MLLPELDLDLDLAYLCDGVSIIEDLFHVEKSSADVQSVFTSEIWHEKDLFVTYLFSYLYGVCLRISPGLNLDNLIVLIIN